MVLLELLYFEIKEFYKGLLQNGIVISDMRKAGHVINIRYETFVLQ